MIKVKIKVHLVYVLCYCHFCFIFVYYSIATIENVRDISMLFLLLENQFAIS